MGGLGGSSTSALSELTKARSSLLHLATKQFNQFRLIGRYLRVPFTHASFFVLTSPYGLVEWHLGEAFAYCLFSDISACWHAVDH